MAVLYHGPLFNQSGLFYLMSYFISLFEEIIQGKPTWCNTVFKTNWVIIYLTFPPFKYKPVFLWKFLHLIDIAFTTFSYSLYLPKNKRIWNIAKTFNNEGICDIYISLIPAVFSIMERRVNCWIVSLILIGQYYFISWQSIYVLSEGMFTLE